MVSQVYRYNKTYQILPTKYLAVDFMSVMPLQAGYF